MLISLFACLKWSRLESYPFHELGEKKFVYYSRGKKQVLFDGSDLLVSAIVAMFCLRVVVGSPRLLGCLVRRLLRIREADEIVCSR